MATIIRSKSGKKIVLLNPQEKTKRFARQMKTGVVRETNKSLSKVDKAYRAGYIAAQRDNQKAYCYKHRIVSQAKQNDVARRKNLKNKKRGK